METVPKTLFQRIVIRAALWAGWRIDAAQPLPAKCVIIGAHHTSWTDLPIALMVREAIGLRFHWAAKDSFFRGPLGWLFHALGGVPVNRRERTKFVERMAALFRQADEFKLVISPEGTRRQTTHWKTGFYYIAQAAQVPIVLGYADYPRKVAGYGPIFMPTDDIEADFAFIRRFYATVTGRYPERHSEIALRESAARNSLPASTPPH